MTILHPPYSTGPFSKGEDILTITGAYMGVSMSWIAVQTGRHQALFDLANLSPTDNTDKYFKSPFSGSALKNGWYLLAGQRCDNRLVQTALLTRPPN
jgi:hypothetical protein